MTTIYRDNTDRLSVADVKRLILESLPPERSAEVYAQVDENGDIDFEGQLEVREVHGVQIYASFIDRDFLPICEQLGIRPRMRYRPAFTDYTWKSSENDTLYTIGHDEFSRVTELFGLSVAVGPAPKPQAAPVVVVSASGVIHSTKTRRDTLTPVIELAQNQCRNPKDAAEVWAALLVMAEKKHPPLIGATEDGLQYLKGGAAANFTRDALGKRLTR